MNLKNKTITAAGWNWSGKITSQVIQFGTLVVMARILSPDDFGVYAIIFIVIGFLQGLGQMGTSEVIIYLDDPDQRMLSSILYLNIIFGLILFTMLYFLAWPLALFFGRAELTILLQITGAIYFINAMGLVQKALLEKSMLFKKLVLLEISALVLSSSAGITAAMGGLGVYSLLIISLLNAIILSLGLWLSSHWRPSFMFSIADIKHIWSYIFNLTGFNTVNYFARNADNFLIGKFLGASALGVYSLAYKIMLYPLQYVSLGIVRALLPAFSQIKHDNIRFKNGYLKAIHYIAFITFPIMLGLMATSETFVDVAFGDKWLGIAPLLIYLAPIGLIQSIVSTVGSIFTAKGTIKLLFRISSANSIVTVLAFIIGLPHGVEGVALAYLIANLIMLYPFLYLSWKQIDLRIVDGLLELSPFFASSLVMASLVYGTSIYLNASGMNKYASLSLQVLGGTIFYVVFMLIFYRPLIQTMIGNFRKR